jgi:hypothetical protein
MSLKDKEARNKYTREWKQAARRKRGLQKQGRKPYTEEQKIEAKEKFSSKESKQIRNQKRMEYTDINVEKKMLWSARRRANKKKLDFNITEEDIIVPTHCPFLGIPLVSAQRRGNSRRDIASLDRIDSSKGYTKDNIEVISWLANTMKNNATPELLIIFAKEILKRYDK